MQSFFGEELMMNRYIYLTLCLLFCMCLPHPPAVAAAEDGSPWGLGLEVQSFGLNIAQLGVDEFFGIHATTMTPYFLFSIRWSPNFFIEPGVGIHMNKHTEDHLTEDRHTLTAENSFRDINFGIAGLYVFRPDNFTSPFLHFGINMHLLDDKISEQHLDYSDNSVITMEGEISAAAVSLSAGLGGMMTIKEHVFLTIEGRLLYSYMGDVKMSLSGPGSQFFRDDTDTKTWTLDTNMVVGFRILM
jgi:hypothetical protein